MNAERKLYHNKLGEIIFVTQGPSTAIALPTDGIIPVDVNTRESVLTQEDNRSTDEVLSFPRVRYKPSVFVSTRVCPTAHAQNDGNTFIQVYCPLVQLIFDVAPWVEFTNLKRFRVECGERVNDVGA